MDNANSRRWFEAAQIKRLSDGSEVTPGLPVAVSAAAGEMRLAASEPLFSSGAINPCVG